MRRNAVVLRNHSIASSACIPSRAALLTGQYGTRTGCSQTDGLFKDGDSAAFPWLSADGIPTLGHWFRAAGYRTHYVGKWHVSNPHEHSLERFGFGGWELSWPEPHGASVNNLGFFRDVGFADLICGFLRRDPREPRSHDGGLVDRRGGRGPGQGRAQQRADEQGEPPKPERACARGPAATWLRALCVLGVVK